MTGFVFYKSRTLNVLTLGHQTATGLGASVSRQTVILLGAAIAMSSLCAAPLAGGLSFVGLVCPHLARRLVGPDFKNIDWCHGTDRRTFNDGFRYYFPDTAVPQ